MCNSHNFDDTNEEYLSDGEEDIRDGYKKCTGNSPRCEKYHNSKFKLCQSCRDYWGASRSKMREKRKSQGLCIECGWQPIASGSENRCEECVKRIADKAKERREKRIEQELCIHCGNRPRVNAQFCDICNTKRHVWDHAYLKSEKGKEYIKRKSAAPVDTDNCLEKATRNEQGEPLCTWTGWPVNLDNYKAWNYRNGDHVDSDSKGLLVVDDANPSNWDSCDGPHNWTLVTASFNFHKGPRCIYVVYEENDPRYLMRPLEDILKDLIRQRVRIPPPKDESVLSASTVEIVNKYRDIQVSTWVYD